MAIIYGRKLKWWENQRALGIATFWLVLLIVALQVGITARLHMIESRVKALEANATL
jgi:hypothetical protein